MEQVIFGGVKNPLDDFFTEYNTLFGGATWDSTEGLEGFIVSTPGKIKNLRVKLDGAPGAGTSYTFTLMVNGVPSLLTCIIQNLETSKADMVNEIAVVAGNKVDLQCVPAGTPTVRNAIWTTMFEGTNAKESIIGGSTYNTSLSNAADRYLQIMTANSGVTIPENDLRQVCPTSGKLKNFYVETRISPGIAPDAYRFTLRINGVNTAVVATVTAPATTGNSGANEVVVAAGNILTILVEPVDTPANSPEAVWGMTFEADIDGESIAMAGSWRDLDTALTEYNHLQTDFADTWTNVEADRYNLGQVTTLKKLHIKLSAFPGAGLSYTFNVRVAGGAGNLTVIVTGAATDTGSDLISTDVIANDNYLGLQCVPAGPPAVADAYWGVVGYIAPPAPPTGLENKSANMGSKMVGAGFI